MIYRPFTNRYTENIVQMIKENIEYCNIDQITIDTLDICHLIGRIKQLEDKNYKLKIKNKKCNEIINKAIQQIKNYKDVFYDYIPIMNLEELLEILKGEDNEI